MLKPLPLALNSCADPRQKPEQPDLDLQVNDTAQLALPPPKDNTKRKASEDEHLRMSNFQSEWAKRMAAGPKPVVAGLRAAAGEKVQNKVGKGSEARISASEIAHPKRSKPGSSKGNGGRSSGRKK